jgi:hypothetical protein
MTRKHSGAALEPLAESAQRRIKHLQAEIARAPVDAERKVRQLERVQLYHSVVTRLNSREAVMPEVACALLRTDRGSSEKGEGGT